MQFGGARWSLGSPRWFPGAATRLPGDYRAQKECLRKFGKWCFLTPGVKREVPTSILVRISTPVVLGL